MIYLDTSAAIPLFIPEPASDAVDAWFESCDETLISSDWILTEFASALSIKVRCGEIEQIRRRRSGRISSPSANPVCGLSRRAGRLSG